MWILQFGYITASDFRVDCGQTLIEVPAYVQSTVVGAGRDYFEVIKLKLS